MDSAVIYSSETEKYSCVPDDTADKWVEQGIAEFPDPEEFIMKSIERKETLLEVEEINQQIREMQNEPRRQENHPEETVRCIRYDTYCFLNQRHQKRKQ